MYCLQAIESVSRLGSTPHFSTGSASVILMLLVSLPWLAIDFKKLERAAGLCRSGVSVSITTLPEAR